MKNALIYTVVFAAIQLVVSGIVQGIWMLIYGPTAVLDATGIIVTMTAFSVLTIVIFLLAKWCVVSRHWLQTRPWTALCWCVIAALGALLPSVWLQELIPQLPNVAEEQFDMILKDRWGYLAVGLLAPFAEELVFRGIILAALLRRYEPRKAIIWSAVIFGIAHLNPWQFIAAFIIGCAIGWLFWRTRSIWIGIFMHWANNTAGFLIGYYSGDMNVSVTDYFGGPMNHAIILIVCAIVTLGCIKAVQKIAPEQSNDDWRQETGTAE